MDFAELVFGRDKEADLSSAWKQLNEKLARDEGNAEDQAWKEKFRDLKSRGFSASAAEIPQAGSDGGYSPGTGTGSGYNEPTPLERWKRQIDGMVTSGNPELQKKGLEMLSNYQNQAASTGGKTDTDDIREYLFAVKRGEFDGSFPEWQASGRSRQYQPTLTTPTTSMDMMVKPELEQKYLERFGRTDIGPGMQMEQIAPYVQSIDSKKMGEAGAAISIADQFDQMLFNPESGIYSDWEKPGGLFDLFKRGATATYQGIVQSDPRYKGYMDSRQGHVVGLAKALGESGNLAIQDVERAKKLIPNISLPLPDSPEVARIKIAMLRKIISANSSKDYASIPGILDAAEKVVEAVGSQADPKSEDAPKGYSE